LYIDAAESQTIAVHEAVYNVRKSSILRPEINMSRGAIQALYLFPVAAAILIGDRST